MRDTVPELRVSGELRGVGMGNGTILQGGTMTREWYAEKACESIVNPPEPNEWGWRDYLARWVWLRDKNLTADPGIT